MHAPLLLASFPLSGTAAALASALIASIWQGLLLTLGVALSLRLLPGLSAAAKAGVWTAVLLLIVALPAISLAIPHANTPGASVLHLEETVSLALVALWAAASAFRLIQLGASAVRLRRILRRAVPVTPGKDISAVLRSGSRHVILCASADVDRPSVAGFLRPRILFPPELLTALSEADLCQIVLHETEHLRRCDDWINLLQQISLVLFPLNPALLWLNRRLSLERELACDDGVLEATRARKAYAACLARVAESALVRRSAALVLGVLGDWFSEWQRKPELTHRVERILRKPGKRMGRSQRRFATGALLAGVLCGSAVLADAPSLVSFTPETSSFAQSDAASAPALPIRTLQLPRPMLVKAILPPQTMSLRHPGIAPAVARARTVRAVAHRRTRAPGVPWVVLTSWRQPATGPQQIAVPTVHLTTLLIQDSQTWYTAVAFRDGWIVVQL